MLPQPGKAANPVPFPRIPEKKAEHTAYRLLRSVPDIANGIFHHSVVPASQIPGRRGQAQASSKHKNRRKRCRACGELERVTRLELATSTLARWRSTR